MLSRMLQATYNFGSNNLRFGPASTLDSLEADGRLKQPFYWNGADWRKLTYSSYSLDFVMKAGGSVAFPSQGESGSELVFGSATVGAPINTP